jgi:hypothetical protein
MFLFWCTAHADWRSHFSTLRHLPIAVLAGLAASPVSYAAEIRSIDIHREGVRFDLVSYSHFDSLPEQVFNVLIDYDHLSGISEAIKESRYLYEYDNGKRLVLTRISACLLFYCRTVKKVERIEFNRPDYILTTVIPDRSNVRYGRSELRLAPDSAGGTLVTIRLEFEPDFWVPPLIGTALIKHALIKFGETAINEIERLAQKQKISHGKQEAP